MSQDQSLSADHPQCGRTRKAVLAVCVPIDGQSSRKHPRRESYFLRGELAALTKNRILLENYFLPGDLEAQIDAFVAHYNHQRYHESLKNLTPADVYTGRGQTILLEREKIKRRTMKLRRLQHAQSAA